MKKLIVMILACALSLVALSCTPSGQSEQRNEPEILGTAEEDTEVIRAFEGFQVGWFNQSYFYQDWLKDFLQKDLITFEVEEKIDGFYALYIPKELAETDCEKRVEGTCGKGYVDGYALLSKRQEVSSSACYVKYGASDEILPQITLNGVEFVIDLCFAKKSVNRVIDLLSGNVLKENLALLVRYPLKIKDGKAVKVDDYTKCDEYENDLELLSLNGVYLTAKVALCDNAFASEIINDKFFFEVKNGNYLYRYAYSLMSEQSANEIFLTEQSFTLEQINSLSGVFTSKAGVGTVLNLSVLKAYLLR